MATIATATPRPLVSKFYVTMAAIFAAIAFSGFFMTYWVQVAQGSFTGGPMLHLHGLLFSLWTLFFLSQALLVANGRLRTHRTWGLLGISLATAMLVTGLAVAIEGERDDISGIGQTKAALDISSGVPHAKKKYFMAKGVGHYGIFNGRKWREKIAPVVEDWIAKNA